MKLFAVILAALALLAGFAGGLRAYSVAAPAQAAPVRISVPHHPKAMPVRPGVTVRWAPCRKPAVRKGRACVTEVTRTVALPPPVVTAQPVPVARAARPHAAPPTRHPSPTARSTSTHDGGHDGGHNGGEHHDDGGHGD